MNNFPPPDQSQRQRALDPARSVLVQAPAGSGKTDLLTRRYLRLLAEVDSPAQIVAITFTIAAAAEMRHRILAELEKVAANPISDADNSSMEALAHRALEHSRQLDWNLIDLPAQLRISTIDSFCRELALQQPLLSGFGGGLEIAEQPDELYHQAARETLTKIDDSGTPLAAAIEELLRWRDNNWQELESLLVEMLSSRDRWMHGFVLEREPDWTSLRERLERPFAQAVRASLTELSQLLDRVPGARQEALALARFACEEPGVNSPMELAECAEFPEDQFEDEIQPSHDFFKLLAAFLQTQKGSWRSEKGLKTSDGFPSTTRGKAGKVRFAALIAQLAAIPALETALAAVRNLPPTRYTDAEWQIVRASFTLLRHAAAELKIAFAEAGRVDFIEVAQLAQRVLRGGDGLPTDAAIAVSDSIRHLLVDEFQDTSRRQHQLLSGLIAAWPEIDSELASRSCFLVGDPMQSIYFFRDADAELFPRVKAAGLEIPHNEPLLLDFLPLQANFRTVPALVDKLNEIFVEVFAVNDGSDVTFSSSTPSRSAVSEFNKSFTLHLDFVPQRGRSRSAEDETAQQAQIAEIVALIQTHQSAINNLRQARAQGDTDQKFRIAILGRAKKHLIPIAESLRVEKIPFRAVELEKLAARPEVLDALALARAIYNPQDRVSWLGVLRAPWCGLSLDDLHTLTGEPELLTRPIPELLTERLPLLTEAGRAATTRLLDALATTVAPPTASLGTRLEELWLRLGGAACVDATARANLDLLWSCLDRLPKGEPELLGAGLDAALDKLTALPDPDADSNCGVQLMTIHKAKGLEFEVVIVPELQAAGGRGKPKMLAWLERGLAEAADSGEITEFLIAPFQRKGEERGSAKAWVDGVYRERESQETRRILYVAATRAREELHLFARPACNEKDGSFTLTEPSNSLLATAWPALAEDVRARFAAWKTAQAASETQESPKSQEIASIAASGESNLLIMPAPPKPALLRRLPLDFGASNSPGVGAPGLDFETWESRLYTSESSGTLYSRHEGGPLSRVLGTAVHALLEDLARLRTTLDWESARSALQRFEPRIHAQARAVGLDYSQAAQIAAQALQLTLSASQDPVGAWLLSPHPGAASEVSWTGVLNSALRTVRIDRLFQAGPAPCAEGRDCWWIIDYKTAHANNLDPADSLPALRSLFATQLEAYAQLLRQMHDTHAPIRAALYYPRLLLLDWWEL